ncbi:hypothetical protein BRADI_3g44391v3 [Brachypodium distachyon]|uniref:OTU domain-containing protein n=1 Tax=Brachypodium distachyon TaxID=15368 RepID=A0A2K2D357_BRADI|nr:hypothetical protein BRADI_3g44391v3 [Brachypodium distachyon]
MESGPGKEDRDARIKIPAHWHRPGQRDYSNAHASTGAQSAVPADGSPPPPRPASLVGPPKERVHEQAGGGSRGTKGSSSAAAGVHQRNKKVGGGIPSPALYPPSSVRRSPSNPLADDDAAYGPGAGLSSPAVGSDKGKGVAWRHPIVTETMTAPQEVRPPPDPFDCKLVFEELFQEQAKINRVKPTDVKETLFRKLKNYFTRKKEEKPGQFIVRTQPKRGKLFWSQVKKIFDRGGRQSYEEHVCYQTIPIREVWNYYPRLHHRAMGLTPCRPSHMAVDQAVVPFNVTSLDAYSEFRRVLGDGECFYRSFIFSYLEQVLDWQDINEEDRLLAVVNRVATQHANLGWTSEFTRSQKAFQNLIKKVIRWKTQDTQGSFATTAAVNRNFSSSSTPMIQRKTFLFSSDYWQLSGYARTVRSMSRLYLGSEEITI